MAVLYHIWHGISEKERKHDTTKAESELSQVQSYCEVSCVAAALRTRMRRLSEPSETKNR